MMDILEKITNTVENLPTLPTIYSTITEAIQNPRTSADNLAKIIATDQVSAIKVLKVANSPFFGFRGKINTISEAVFYLGFNEIRNIIFALTVINYFAKNTIVKPFHPKDFWAHSIATGIAARLIGASLGQSNLENYFLAGILHDIGKLVLLQSAKNEYAKVGELVEKQKISIRDAESEVLKINHATVGHALALKWKLPPTLQEVIANHHTPSKDHPDAKIIASTYLANNVVKLLQMGNAGDDVVPRPNPVVWEVLSIPNGFFSKMLDQLENDYQYTIKTMLTER